MSVIPVDIKDVKAMLAGYVLVEYEAGTDPIADGFCLLVSTPTSRIRVYDVKTLNARRPTVQSGRSSPR